ncbi:MAG: dihydroorotate dehydrogenase [Ignavibacteria bacterium GWB2_35_12]|nr:MAG: dihydroorotate dehydrogenase [Ignavibacteria bacterium GWA2_35_8]OGU40068.1 MAG: dihydroorotate dehydrogenase [Ignavibacteria bacterium GWB2_35_12]OGU94012.1 MAG: dihydroorotate dehydrogenase [Ignavibacteria bacterium RIFOXYA2_FULL_35_10]OGV22869.1 MAG: dihydroorotate dehydrogenase [Ignavibacteria bacterium RIFOXYC2_FULL_35_21]
MDITTKYMGMNLRSPLVVSASPLSEDIGNIKQIEDSGAGAVVLYSLFEEQIVSEQKDLFYHTSLGDISPEALTFFPEQDEYRLAPDEYLNHIRKAKEAVKIPVIASINGATTGGWVNFAKKMQEAGANAIELNIYYIPTELGLSGNDVEQTYIEILKSVKSTVKIPIAVKLSPFFSNMANMAHQLDIAGADALVLFNRFYQPDIDLENLEVKQNILLSHASSARLPLRWIAIMKGRIKADLAATSGIHSGTDAIKMLLAGANVTMLCSILLKNGIDYIKVIEKQMLDWLESKEYESVKQLIGSMCQLKNADPSSFERAQYMKAISKYKF